MERTDYISKIEEYLKVFQITAILGCRQAGKTTLASQVGKQWQKQGKQVHYFDLEDPKDWSRITENMLLLEHLEGLIIIDEIQREPSIFPYLRVLADRKPLPARFLILGSATGKLFNRSSESLAGRLGYIELTGFNLDEVGTHEWQKLWIRGGFPRSFLAETNEESYLWREAFLKNFLTVDLPGLGSEVQPQAMWRFWQMAAHYHGQIWNHSEIGKSLGISDKAIKRYLDLLTDALVVRQLLPWFVNIGKRITKSPKFFVRDSGIFHNLLYLKDQNAIERHPKLGASWEGFALEQILQKSAADSNAYYYHVQSEGEIDLIIPVNGQHWGIEFKFAETPKVTPLLHRANKDLGLERIVIVTPDYKATTKGSTQYSLGDKIEVMPLSNFLSTIK